MPWYGKEQPTPFDHASIEGLMFLDNRILAQLYRQLLFEDRKYPILTFPSGLQRELTRNETVDEEQVHLFGALHVPRHGTRGDAVQAIRSQAEALGYVVELHGERHLTVFNPKATSRYRATYDNARRKLVDIVRFDLDEELLSTPLRAVLPPFQNDATIDLNAIPPVKFATPDDKHIWYPCAFDGYDTFFGLMVGETVEIGTFSLTHIETFRDNAGQQVQRNVSYQPTPLQHLKETHDAQRAASLIVVTPPAEEDPRTPEEIERDRLRAAQELTAPLFDDKTPHTDLLPNSENTPVLPPKTSRRSRKKTQNNQESADGQRITQQVETLLQLYRLQSETPLDGSLISTALLNLTTAVYAAYQQGASEQTVQESVHAGLEHKPPSTEATRTDLYELAYWNKVYQKSEEFWMPPNDLTPPKKTSRKRSTKKDMNTPVKQPHNRQKAALSESIPS